MRLSYSKITLEIGSKVAFNQYLSSSSSFNSTYYIILVPFGRPLSAFASLILYILARRSILACTDGSSSCTSNRGTIITRVLLRSSIFSFIFSISYSKVSSLTMSIVASVFLWSSSPLSLVSSVITSLLSLSRALKDDGKSKSNSTMYFSNISFAWCLLMLARS